MTTELPTEKPSFILCEDVREEAGQKASFLGVFLGDIIVNPIPNQSKDTKVHLNSITCVFNFRDGQGDFTAKIGLTSPSQIELLANTEQQVITKLENQAMNIIFKLVPFPVEEGTYRAWVELNDKRFENSFRVTMGRVE